MWTCEKIEFITKLKLSKRLRGWGMVAGSRKNKDNSVTSTAKGTKGSDLEWVTLSFGLI